ncbi:hypothetical protein GCM10009677_28940 [Sphaerisporangium rubeum]|uniref:ATP-binding protein n=1 Tax=Sphaerisporangium rubeum TaxID=321317 RepID=UPI0016143573
MNRSPDKPLNQIGNVLLLARASSVQLAREYVCAQLTLVGVPIPEDLEILTSELMTNAIKHSDSGRLPGFVRLRVFADQRMIRVSINDAGAKAGSVPRILPQADPMAENGRGLWLIQELSHQWGWMEDPTGRLVWFEMLTPRVPSSMSRRSDPMV